METPIKMDNLGVPPIFWNTHLAKRDPNLSWLREFCVPWILGILFLKATRETLWEIFDIDSLDARPQKTQDASQQMEGFKVGIPRT